MIGTLWALLHSLGEDMEEKRNEKEKNADSNF